jgi:plasmid replication initiation protein
METVVEFDVLEEDGKSSWEAMVLLSYARIKDGECTYRYERALAEKLYHPDVYSKINLSVLREMNSAHALVLYENCYRYVDIGHTAWWDVDVFRKLMAVDTMPSYKPFKALNRNVIQPAMKEVNKLSNIQVAMETVMQGRTVTSLRFIVRPNAQLSLIGMEEDDAINSSPAYKALLAEGISKTLARAWVLEHEESYIFEKLELANGQAASGKIKSSKAGFLKSAIEEDFKSEVSVKKQKLALAEDRKADKRRKEAELEALKAELKSIELLYRQSCVSMVEDAFELLPLDEQEALTLEFQQGLSSRIFVDDFKKRGWQSPLIFSDIRAFWEARGLSLPSPALHAEKRGSKEPASLSARIKELEKELG